MRGAALKVLPPETYILLKQDVVIKRLGGAENYIKECKESSCIVDLGKKAQVDYVAQASVGKLGNKMRLKVELYDVRTEGLVSLFDGDGEYFDDYFALLESVDKNVPNVFRSCVKTEVGEEKVVAPLSQGFEGKFRFGARANVGITNTMGEKVTTNGNSMNPKPGIIGGFGAFCLIPIPWVSIYIVPEIAYQYRQPVVGFNFSDERNSMFGDVYGRRFENLSLTETAIEIPVIFRFRYLEENLIYLGIGSFFGFVLSSDYNDDNGITNVKNEYRDKIDYGIAYELGFRINKNFSIDTRGIVNFTSIGFFKYMEVTNNNSDLSLAQTQIGVSYAF
jgi:hypothetical protein